MDCRAFPGQGSYRFQCSLRGFWPKIGNLSGHGVERVPPACYPATNATSGVANGAGPDARFAAGEGAGSRAASEAVSDRRARPARALAREFVKSEA